MAVQTYTSQETAADVIKDTYQGAKGAVNEAVDSVKETVDTAIDAAADTASDARRTVAYAFDDAADYLRRDGWLIVGSALFFGLMVGCLLHQARR